MPHRTQRDNTLSWILAAAPIPTGLTIALFNDRFISHSWKFAGGIPGGYTMWSGALLACGVFMVAAMIASHHRRTNPHQPNREALLITGMTIVALWWFLLGAVFAAAAMVDHLANPFGAVLCWLPCVIYVTWAWYERHQL